MSTTTPAVKVVDPPFYDPPIVDYASGQQHSQAWTEYHQSVADQLSTLAANQGVTDGSDAAAGRVGEYLTASGSAGVAVGVATVVATLPLPAGDWSVEGNVSFALTGSAVWQCLASVSTSSGGLGPIVQNVAVPAGFTTCALGTGGAVRQSANAAITVYLMAQAGFTGALHATGTIWARRVR